NHSRHGIIILSLRREAQRRRRSAVIALGTANESAGRVAAGQQSIDAICAILRGATLLSHPVRVGPKVRWLLPCRRVQTGYMHLEYSRTKPASSPLKRGPK